MPAELIDVRAPADASDAIERAAGSLRSGRIVVLPTETVYGIAAAASVPGAVDHLWRIKGTDRRAPLAWHVHSTAALYDALSLASIHPTAVHRRLIRLFTPGPVTLAIAADAGELSALRRHLGVGADVFDDGQELLVRIPDRRVTRDVLERAGVPVVAASAGGARLARTGNEAEALIHDAELIIDDGPTTFSTQSTLVRLVAGGGYEVLREGALDQRTIRKRMARTLLFVCTGNTCRSPMAAAIARHLIASVNPTGIETTIKSAGTSAGFGMEATPEGVDALRAVGIEMGRHASAPLSREMVNDAEIIYGMTRAHVEAVLRLEPSARGRVQLLDPTGDDIADPIGSPREVYDHTARAMRRAIEQRLKELPE